MLGELNQNEVTQEVKQILSQGSVKDGICNSFDVLFGQCKFLIQVFEISTPDEEDHLKCKHTGKFKHSSLFCSCVKGVFSSNWSVKPKSCDKVYTFLLHKTGPKLITNLSEFQNNITKPQFLNSKQICQYLEGVNAIIPSENFDVPTQKERLKPNTTLRYFSSKFPPKLEKNIGNTYRFMEYTSGYMSTGKYLYYFHYYYYSA